MPRSLSVRLGSVDPRVAVDQLTVTEMEPGIAHGGLLAGARLVPRWLLQGGARFFGRAETGPLSARSAVLTTPGDWVTVVDEAGGIVDTLRLANAEGGGRLGGSRGGAARGRPRGRPRAAH